MKRNRQSVEDRHSKILVLLQEQGEIKVETLSQMFDVSLMTIRRDLQHLEDCGRITRFYGGAQVVSQPTQDEVRNRVELYRRLIGMYAARCVKNGERIFINGSRTALGLLDHLERKEVRVFTNNGQACKQPYPSNIRLTLSGGNVWEDSGILTGDCAMRNLLMERSSKAFIGCTGISPNGELLCGIPSELAINETMMEHADQYFILADHTKIGVTGTYASWHLEKKGTVITDELASASVVAQLRLIGMTVIQVKATDFA